MAIPQQMNGYDCGMFVIIVTELLVGRLNANDQDAVAAKPGNASAWRLENATSLRSDRVSARRMELKRAALA
ncbi:hypothetical protein HDU82_005149 [Entophlyctis luteolus]|nr:hypothetical protein HDU82_005149 [Entophlyctis luteolus]